MPDIIPDVDAIPDQPQEMYFIKRCLRWLNDRLQELKLVVDQLQNVVAPAQVDLSTRMGVIERKVTALENVPAVVVPTPGTAKVSGRVDYTGATTTTSGTGFTQAFSKALGANFVDTDGDALWLVAWGQGGSTAANKQVRVSLGAASLDAVGVAASSLNGVAWWINVFILRTASGAQRWVSIRSPDGSLTTNLSYVQATTQDWTTDLTVKVEIATSDAGDPFNCQGVDLVVYRKHQTVNIP